MTKSFRSTLALLAFGCVLIAPGSVIVAPALLAQTAPSPVCLVKSPTGAVALTVMVSPARQSELEAAGFSAQACAGKEAATAQYRSEICALASGMPQGGQQQFSQTYGVAPSRLCTLAGEL